MSLKYKIEGPSLHTASEPLAAYITTHNVVESFIGLISGLSVNKAASLNDWDIVKLTRQGLPKRALMLFIKKVSLTLTELANIMHISERTLQRYDDDEIVKTEYAEKVINLARLYDRGIDVFDSVDKFKIWIRTPSVIFKNETPLSLLDTSVGFEMVVDELGRIEHGIFA